MDAYFSYEDTPWFKYNDKIKYVIIENGITDIGNLAFKRCENLISVDIPDSVLTLGHSAFDSCYKLTDIKLSKNLKEISFYAFAECNSLVSINIPDGVTGVSQLAFYNCANLRTIYLPNSIKYILSDAFEDCDNLTDVYYNGTEEQWNTIKYINRNEQLLNANIHFNSIKPKVFDDLNGFEFYDEFVAYTSVYNEFLKGTNPPYNTVFEPARAIDRAMMVTILYRMAGEPYANGGNPYTSSPFTDITNTSVYYYDAACWALKNGVTTETTFKPFNNVTREQTATFLYRYAQDNDKLGDADYKNVNLNAYHDGNSISHFAVDAMKWANYNSMITGTQQGYANPQGATQRIHATKILYGFGKVCNIGNFS